MLGWIARLIEGCLSPERIPDPEDRRRGRVLLSGSLLLSGLALLVFINTLRLPTSRLVNYVGVGGLSLVFASVPWVVRATGRVQMAGGWAVGWATLLLTVLVSSGGMTAPALPWLLFMPLIAYFFVGRAFALAVLLASVSAVSAVYGATLAGHRFQPSYQGDQLNHLRWLAGVAFAITTMAVATLYDSARQRALRLQQQINTQLRESNDKLARAKEAAEAANHAKSTFLATVSHELRTPLHGVLAMTEALQQRRRLTPAAREQVAIASRSAQSLKALIEDLLQLSEIEAGEVRIVPGPWPVRRGVADLMRIFRPQAEEKGLTLTLEVAADVPVAVQLDALRVQQVVSNLLGNAVKFTDAGSVAVRVSWRAPETPETPQATGPQEDAMSQLIVTVADTGTGVEAALYDQIFEPFVRADSSSTRRHGGTGLGLAVSRKLTQRMGGTLILQSEVGVGSTFTVGLPTPPADEPEVDVLDALGAPTPAQQHPAVTLQPRVLVADDSVICQQVMAQLLGPLGYDVTLVSDGQEALDALAAAPFDIVLMDCEMPILDGIAAVRLLRQRESPEARTVVIAVTAHGLDEHREICAAAGMDDVLSKPFRLADLQVLLARWLAAPGAT